MANFFIDNGNKIDLLQLKEGSAIKSDDKFLKKYDKNNNCIWDTDEIEQFMADLENSDVNCDGKIDDDESVSWYARVMNTTLDKAKSIFTDNDTNEVYQSFNNIIKETAEEQSVTRMNQNAKEALLIYRTAVGGSISKTYNCVKELFDTEYAGDKVYRQLARNQVSAWLLEKAHSSDGLTGKEYITEKIALLKALLMGEGNTLSDTEQKNIEESIYQMDLNDLDMYILRLSNAENSEYSSVQKDVIENIIMNNSNNSDSSLYKLNLNSVKSFLASSQAEEKIPFDKIFELETGVPFNQANSIQEYENKYLETCVIMSTYNKVSEVNQFLSADITPMEQYNKYGSQTGLPEERDFLYKKLSNSILSALQQFYGNDNEKINKVLAKYNANLKDDTIIFKSHKIGADFAIVDMAKSILNDIQANLSTLMDGKTINDYQNELQSAYQLAYGAKNSVDLASKFQESQQEGVEYIELGVSVGGIALAVLSDGTLLPIIGMTLGTFGSGVIKGVEAATKEGGITRDEINEISKELLTSGVLTLAGMKEGEIAAKIGHKLLQSCPKLLQYTAEYGSMAVMGALTDYAVMGEINLTQESISNLINIATGIIAHKKISGMQKKQLIDVSDQNVTDDIFIMNKFMDEVWNSNNIETTREKIINSSEFKELLPDNQNLLIKTIDDYAAIYSIADDNIKDTKVLFKIKSSRGCSNEDIGNLYGFLVKYPQYKNEILDIIKSNYNIKFSQTLDGSIANHIDTIVKLIEANPNYKKQIIDYIKVQRRAKNDTTNPTEGINKYIETLNKYPEHRDFIEELSKNPNLDAMSADGGINTIEAALDLYLSSEGRFKKEDILILSKQNYALPSIRMYLLRIEKYPALRDIILNEVPNYQLIDSVPENTSSDMIKKRFSIKENLEQNYANEMKELRQTLGDEFFFKVKWEEIIPDNAAPQDIKAILDTINESSKFFARTSVNEQSYGKNIKWAAKINDISKEAQYMISEGRDLESVLNFISIDYNAYDVATTLETNNSRRNDRRKASGKYRGYDDPESFATTQFEKDGNYAEYFDRFTKVPKKRQAPYDDICLTKIFYDKDTEAGIGTMFHPANKYVNPGIAHMSERYNELQPLIEKVKNGQKLTKKDIEFANDKISEIYFLMANVMPYERGSNGISDILMRSIYRSLGIEQPALKHGVSLDLEAFCMDLNDYKKKWNSFFEGN